MERTASQLNFRDIAQSASVGDGTQNSGNPDLQPEQAWVTELGVERRWGERGVLDLTLVHEAITDVLVLIPVTGPGGQPRSADALGNLPEASRWGFDLTGTWPVSPTFELALRWQWRDTRHDDPVLGEETPLPGWPRRELRPSFTHKLSGGQLEWGGYYLHSIRVIETRLSQTFTTNDPGSWGLWLRWTPRAQVSVEAGINAPAGDSLRRTRADFDPDHSSRVRVRQQIREQDQRGNAYLNVRLTW